MPIPVSRPLPELNAGSAAAVRALKYGSQPGWGPQLRARFGYITPDEVYETIVADAVRPGSRWLDVGCGRDTFPDNHALAARLSRTCARLVGVDPDPSIADNQFIHERYQTTIEGLPTDRRFDVITLRMVAEHIEDPDAAVRALACLTQPGGVVVVYTVYKWSPAAIAAALLPFRWHHTVKSIVWQTQEADTFPVAYRMNDRTALHRLFTNAGFTCLGIGLIDDCRTFARFRLLHTLELAAWRLCAAFGIRYPECCLLGIYQRG